MTPALSRGSNFFVGYAPDLTGKSTQPIITVLRKIDGEFDEDFQSQSHSNWTFKLQFLGEKFNATEAYTDSFCSQIRNVHGARIPSLDDQYVYHCGNINVSAPIHLANDAKGRFAFVATLKFMCQRLTQEGS